MLVLLVYLGRDQSHTCLCAMYLQGLVRCWRGGAAISLNCFSRLISLISPIEITGAMTQCQGVCGFLRHFPCKWCAKRIYSASCHSITYKRLTPSDFSEQIFLEWSKQRKTNYVQFKWDQVLKRHLRWLLKTQHPHQTLHLDINRSS